MDMTSLNISLPQALKEFAEEQAARGGYTSVSEYCRELLRAAQRQQAEAKLEALLLEGVESGPAQPMTEKDWEEHRRRLREYLASRQQRQA